MQWIEIFKTDIDCPERAKMIVQQIHASFAKYQANFDLEDCDKILRIVASENIAATNFVDWLKGYGCNAVIFNQ